MSTTPLSQDDPRSLGAFRLTGRLGEGGQGVVYLGQTPGGEQVAVKLLFGADAETRARLARELSALESVAPFCTARVLAASVDGPRPYVVSEFVDGPSLQQRIRERGPLRGGELERLVVGTATALAAIHAAGVVHRDFKPANVLLGPDGPRVVDFGIARADGAATMTSGIVGTPAYMAPEQIGGSPASPASDVFAWAATMLCAASGRSPFGADTLPAVLNRILNHRPDLSVLPARLAGLIGACLDKDPARRPTARSLMVSLVDPGGQAPPSGKPVGGTVTGEATGGAKAGESTGEGGADLRTQASRRRSGTVLGAGLAAVALVAAGGVTVWYLTGGPGSVPASTGGPHVTGTPAGATVSPPEESRGEYDDLPGDVYDTGEPVPESSAGPGGAGVPAAFAGTWSGHIKPTDPTGLFSTLREHDVTIVLAQGEKSGSWTEPTSGCSGTLALTRTSGKTLGFELKVHDVLQCVPGDLTLTGKGGRLAYHWTDGMGFGTTYDGVLSRK
ncbi:serine/threonine-protein kinase [Streptosporangium sp. NPDC020072]|uniref:serine/threonine-protein kinase n=1 Tax=Streptosporangium sp. NPDC020072 TaxID=3154788 RepID=UPI00344402DE